MSSANFGSDPWLDAQLRNVPLPVGYLNRLQEAGPAASLRSDEQIDAALTDVPLPAGLLDRLRDVSRPRRPAIRWSQLAVAASLLVAVSSTLMAAFAMRMLSDYRVAHEQRQNDDAAMLAKDAGLDGDETGNDGFGKIASGPRELPAPAVPPSGDPPLIVAPDSAPAWNALGSPQLARAVPAAPGPIRKPETIYFTDATADRLPHLPSVEKLQSRGVAPPKAPGYDLIFQLKHGEHPFVSPSAHKDLRGCVVPLITESASYALAQRSVEEGRLPPADEVRMEDFLAAVDYHFPESSAPVAIRSAAGPAPLGERGLRLLQVAAQAGRLLAQKRAPAHLTIAVDTSASMRWNGRLEMVRQALASLVSRLEAGDRLTLIAFSDQPEVLVDGATRQDSAQLRAAIESLAPGNGTNLGAGLSAACTAARRESGAAAKRLIVITDGVAELPGDMASRLCETLSRAAADGVALTMIDVSSDDAADEQLQSFARAGEGRALQVAGTEQLRYSLWETLLGRSTVVAERVSLKVLFNPAAVTSYRLLGHEAVTLTSGGAAGLEVDLRAGQAAAGLFEMWLNPGGGDDVATVELTWQEPATGKPRRATQRVSRLQFAKSFAESAPSLQAAAVVAETAKTLHGSYFSPGARSIGRVLELAMQTHPRLQEEPSFRDFTQFLQRAEKIRQPSR